MPNVFEPDWDEWELPPGQAAYPHHVHLAEQEVPVVLAIAQGTAEVVVHPTRTASPSPTGGGTHGPAGVLPARGRGPVTSALAERTLELVDVASESHDEAALAAHVLGVLAPAGARDAGDRCVVAGVTERSADDRPLVLLAGHLDTVPPRDNRPGRIADGAVHGLGACDMKGALAVMVELALAPPAGAQVDLGFVFFPREELPFTDSALTPLLGREPGLARADLAIVMEPTANALQAGCLGNLNATWTFHGTAGHSARPWLADNAIHRMGRGIAHVASEPPRRHDVHGLEYVEVTSVTQVSGGIARNVIPDTATGCSTTATRPAARRPRPRRCCARCAPGTAS
jgi:acetylornithine deacetylase/succinyl-diaminopimelate desuccinylase-like protein